MGDWKISGLLREAADFSAAAAMHLILPHVCSGCGADLPFRRDPPFCASCAAALKKLPDLHCKRCGAVLDGGGAHCFYCRGSKADSYRCKIIRSAFRMTPELLSAVHEFKYGNRPSLALYFAPFMAEAFIRFEELHEADLLVPVPLSPERRKERGYNQSALLAAEVARLLDKQLETEVLVKVRPTSSQTRLNRDERARNVNGAFAAVNAGRIKGCTVLLVDDVATTGATLEACAAALKKGGAGRVLALTLARE